MYRYKFGFVPNSLFAEDVTKGIGKEDERRKKNEVDC